MLISTWDEQLSHDNSHPIPPTAHKRGVTITAMPAGYQTFPPATNHASHIFNTHVAYNNKHTKARLLQPNLVKIRSRALLHALGKKETKHITQPQFSLYSGSSAYLASSLSFSRCCLPSSVVASIISSSRLRIPAYRALLAKLRTQAGHAVDVPLRACPLRLPPPPPSSAPAPC